MCIPSEGRNQAFFHLPILLSLFHKVIQMGLLKELIMERGGIDIS